jgi:hypothetical protein
MPKAEPGSLKDLANKSKAKGLGKLRFYCEMCQKQCRDENGFKCHTLGDAHLRQMALFSANSERFMDKFSTEFDGAFMELLRRRFGTRRVMGNLVYNEYIQDKTHVHMNATMWPTLTDYIKYLGRMGKCEVEECEQGWYVTYIDRDPEAIRRAEVAARRRAADSAEEARYEDEVVAVAAMAAAAAAAAAGSGAAAGEAQHLLVGDGGGGGGGGRLGLSLGLGAARLRGAGATATVALGGVGDDDEDEEEEDEEEEEEEEDGEGGGGAASIAGTKRSRWDGGSTAAGSFHQGPGSVASKRPFAAGVAGAHSHLPQFMSLLEEERAAKLRQEQRRAAVAAAAAAAAGPPPPPPPAPPPPPPEGWLLPNLVVRVMEPNVGGGAYLKQKGVVRAVEEGGAVGRVEMLGSGHVLRVDCADLETVLPRAGGAVYVVKGPRRGAAGVLARIHAERFVADVELEGGGALRDVEYDAVCKASAGGGGES